MRDAAIDIAGATVGVEINPDSQFEGPVKVTKQLRWETKINIGAFSMIHGGGTVVAADIGRYASIAPGAIIGANEHAMNWITTSSIAENPNLYDWANRLGHPEAVQYGRPFNDSIKMIDIGNDVWIGQNVFIKGGVKIGDGAVVAAHSVVNSDVPPFHVVAGVPAKFIKLRFPVEIIVQIQELKWWQYSFFDIARLPIDKPDVFCNELRRLVDSGSIEVFQPKEVRFRDV